jgi:hypothetical protein
MNVIAQWAKPSETMTEAHFAERVATPVFEQGLARVPRPDDIGALIRTCTYHPLYSE